MATTDFITIRFSSGEQYVLRRDFLEKLYRDKAKVSNATIPPDNRNFVDLCRKELHWFDIRDIAERVEANESFEWSHGPLEVVKSETAEIPTVQIITHLEVRFPNATTYTFEFDLLCVAIADSYVRDEGMSFPYADALYSHLIGEANSLISAPENLIDRLKEDWDRLASLAHKDISEAEAETDYQSLIAGDYVDIRFLESEIDVSEVTSTEVSVKNIASLRERVKDAVWG